MARAAVEGISLEYEVFGEGEPVLLIHGALIADAYAPLVVEPALAGRYRLVTYHRQGYLGSGRSEGSVTLERQAADAWGVLRHAGVEHAHVVGHSFGGSVALQLALDAPDLVHSLALLEPALAVGDSARAYRDSLSRAADEYRAGDVPKVVDALLEPRFGKGYRSYLDSAVPGAFDAAVAGAETAIMVDMSSLLDWHFTEAEARRISQPVLSVLGAESNALWSRFGETHQTLLTWLPHAEGFILPGATHALQMQNPRDMAQALAHFLARHPFPSPK